MKKFVDRHIGPSVEEVSSMLKFLGEKNLEDIISKGVPREVLNTQSLNLPVSLTESELIAYTRKQAAKNKTFKNYIGQGFYECLSLSVTNRNIIKNPVWYTAYTPYQAELAQGRLEALLNFQTMVCDLTGMDLSNASLLDESTACAEAMFMALNNTESQSKTFFVNDNIWDQTLSVLKTRAEALDIQIQRGSLLNDKIEDVFAVFLQYPFADGSIPDLKNILQQLKQKNIPIIVSTDLLACCLIEPLSADIVVGSTGRLGMPLLYGGPHSAFLAVKKQYANQIPGRIVGVSKDRDHNPALRLALQTREQHIRRERATSNICTSQVLPAVLSSMYAVYHGPEGLRSIAREIHKQVLYLYENLKFCPLINHTFFDTLSFQLNSDQKKKIKKLSEAKGINLGYSRGNQVNISVGEGRTLSDMNELIELFKQVFVSSKQTAKKAEGVPKHLARKSLFMTHPVFNNYHSETKLIRYIHYLQDKDLTLAHSMIPLGSCTMKLNATTELQPMTWKGFSDIHPFAPLDQVKGSLEIFKELEDFLCEITGFSKISLQPNAGSQGEYAGLIIFRKYHQSIGEGGRNVCLIPSSAHGTNPASARMAGLKVVTVRCNAEGGIDWNDLQQKAEAHSKNLSCLMLTYPSTCGVFEENISRISSIIHKHGGLVYFDGANMNALTGLCRPALLGVDAGHLNLHKTFCIPHGGGGPGVGPVGVVKKLEKFLPSHPFFENSPFTISSAPYGNAGVLSISWAYIRMMGFEGLKKASQTAILNANYIKKRLEPYYRILFTGLNQQVAHECIVDLRKFKYSAEVDVVDVAKRLMDYGFHSPTMSWPVPGTLMIEPTESEDKAELDRFCEALISIRKEIEEIEGDKVDKKNNLLKNAPHTIQDLCKDHWNFPYTKHRACFPLPYLKQKKFWPSVARIQEAYGDIHLFCSCPPVEDSSSDTSSTVYTVVPQTSSSL
ncbi:MAG: aminomethyl-transferring glycine dehydrogenase [Bdellovibrionales bacterium]|nr:aminomethyl-transferring glycine dehydrogenase [Bdellovibrionales bacterium]